jgi:hypothetical protein
MSQQQYFTTLEPRLKPIKASKKYKKSDSNATLNEKQEFIQLVERSAVKIQKWFRVMLFRVRMSKHLANKRRKLQEIRVRMVGMWLK